jgi:hypothetical protein
MPPTTPDPQTAATPSVPENEQALAPSSKGARVPVRMGISPSTLDEAWRFAQIFATSELVPKPFRGKPADVLVAMELGMELGLAPLQALQSIAVINGRPSIWGDGVLAIILASPLYADHDEYYVVNGERREGLTADDWHDTTAAVCTFIRRHKATPVTRRFTVAQAKKAGLLTKDGPWQTHPDRMLAMRARGFASRDAFPDLLRGVKAAEEVEDIDDVDDDVAPTQPAQVRRISQTPTVSSAPIVPPPSPLTVGPSAITSVTPFLGGFVVQLADGTLLETCNGNDAADLDKVTTTGHRYTFTCERARPGMNPTITSFAIAE